MQNNVKLERFVSLVSIKATWVLAPDGVAYHALDTFSQSSYKTKIICNIIYVYFFLVE
jgi:hypothetical protein